MGSDNRRKAYRYLLRQSEQKGYILFKDIMRCADRSALSMRDTDWLLNSITAGRMPVYYDISAAARFCKDDESDAYTQSGYDAVFDKVIARDPSLKYFIRSARKIKPPQTHEMDQLKHLVRKGSMYARTRVIEMHIRLAVRIALQSAEMYDSDVADAIHVETVCLMSRDGA